jgi:hypothetical protein
MGVKIFCVVSFGNSSYVLPNAKTITHRLKKILNCIDAISNLKCIILVF